MALVEFYIYSESLSLLILRTNLLVSSIIAPANILSHFWRFSSRVSIQWISYKVGFTLRFVEITIE